jgi:hypothetical protein
MFDAYVRISTGRFPMLVCLSALEVVAGHSAKADVQATIGSASAKPPATHEFRGGLLTVGVFTFGLSWGSAMVVGGFGWLGATVDNENCGRCGSQAKLMFVPLAGPLLAESRQDVRDLDFSSWIYWTWTAVEAAGVAMIVVGLIGHDVAQADGMRPGPAVTVVPVVQNGLRALALNMRW